MKVRELLDDHIEAGGLLAERLLPHAGSPRLLVIGLTEAGVPLAEEVGRMLGCAPAILPVCKLRVPNRPELTLGAMAAGGVRVLNNALVYHLGLSEGEIQPFARATEEELLRRERRCPRHPDPEMIRHRTVIIVDDAVVTGCTMRAAIQAVHRGRPERVIVAVPVVAAACLDDLRAQADAVVVVEVPPEPGTVRACLRGRRSGRGRPTVSQSRTGAALGVPHGSGVPERNGGRGHAMAGDSDL